MSKAYQRPVYVECVGDSGADSTRDMMTTALSKLEAAGAQRPYYILLPAAKFDDKNFLDEMRRGFPGVEIIRQPKISV